MNEFYEKNESDTLFIGSLGGFIAVIALAFLLGANCLVESCCYEIRHSVVENNIMSKFLLMLIY